MDRRLFLSFFALFPVLAHAANPWRARIFNGGRLGSKLLGGVHVTLNTGWKTYWKVPGAGGVPPDISITGSNVATVRVMLPLPLRIPSPEGEVLGYKDEVVFPFEVSPVDPTQPCIVDVSAFLGICESFCIPVSLQETLTLDPVKSDPRDQSLLQQWHGRVPVRANGENVNITAEALEHDGRPHVRILLDRPAPDLFVIGDSRFYFQGPRWIVPAREALIRVDGAKSVADIRGREISILFESMPTPLEVVVRVG